MGQFLKRFLELVALLVMAVGVSGAEPSRMAVVLLNDGTGFRGAVCGIADGHLRLKCQDGERTVRLTDVRSLVFDASDAPAIAEPPPPPTLKIGLVQIEIRDSVRKAQQRLDRTRRCGISMIHSVRPAALSGSVNSNKITLD